MSPRSLANAIEILLVEDNPGDILLTQEVLSECKILNKVVIARDGEEALDQLGGSYRPDLILLDLNLPRKSGREVLEEIKHHPSLKSIPVIILTTSEAETDILKSYELHANCYLTKPVGLGDFVKVIQSIETFWMMIVNLPSRP